MKDYFTIQICILIGTVSFLFSLPNIPDKCVYDESISRELQRQLGSNWGYGYDDLLVDLEFWSDHYLVQIDSLGASVQNRALWQLTITSDSIPSEPRHTIFMHARTHPNETQGWWVANEFINLLLSDDPYATYMRDECTFHIIPMYNPDGVELEYPRQNANGIDIESNWDADPVEPEVAVLRGRFEELMNSDAPIEIALNMHSSSSCKRYFVYHHENGTSVSYTQLEQQFLNGIQSYFMTGIESWDYFISWTSGTPTYYPESWFWLNHGESVMALTYEDMHCSEAGLYDSTAYALLHGIGDYLGLNPMVNVGNNNSVPLQITLYQNYPNPFNAITTIRYKLSKNVRVRLTIMNILGHELAVLIDRDKQPGIHEVQWDGSLTTSGVYLLHLITQDQQLTKKILFVK